jgi:hypothetical protein
LLAALLDLLRETWHLPEASAERSLAAAAG